MPRRGPVALLALVVVAAVIVWTNLAVAALTVCLNESPALASDIASSLPWLHALAGWALPLFAPLGVTATSPPTCDPAAQARAMGLAGISYLAAILILDRGRIPIRVAWALVIGVGSAARLVMFFMPALLSSDIIDYATHGRVASLHGANPYLQTPSQFPGDPFSSLGAWPTVVTVYGPLWTQIDAAVTGLLPDATLVQLIFAYKLIALVADVGSVLLIFWIVRRWRVVGATTVAPVVAVAMWLLNPLVNVELIGNAHNESLMIACVLLGVACVTVSAKRPAAPWAWAAALVSIWLGTLVKFVPAALEAVVTLVWLSSAPVPPGNRALHAGWYVVRLVVLVLALAALTLLVAAPWLGSPAVAAPLVGLASGGQRFKDVWQDAPAAWLTVRLVPLLGVPDDPATLRMDIARVIVWSLTRFVFAVYLLLEGLHLWRHANGSTAEVLRNIANASVRVLLLALLLYTSQVYAWYFLWPLPLACLLGPRHFWTRATLIFGLTFLPAYYLREFAPFGVFEMPRYAELSLGILAAWWLTSGLPAAQVVGRVTLDLGESRRPGSSHGGADSSHALPP